MTTTQPFADWPSHLRALGKRVTRQRVAVLQAVDAHPHATAERIHTAARELVPDITLQSVYIVLADATAWGLVRKLDDVPARYETRVGDNHHHLICVQCGVILDVDCVVGTPPCLHPPTGHGMEILSADITFRGVCADCRAPESPRPDPESQPTGGTHG